MKEGSVKIIFLLIIFLLGSTGVSFSSEERHLTADEAVSMALAENLNLKLRKNEVVAGEGLELVEQGVFDPSFEAGVASQEQKITNLVTGGEEKEKASGWNVSIKKKLTTGTEVAVSWENYLYDTDSNQVVLDPYYNSTLGLSISQQLWRGNSREVQTAGIRAAEKYTEAVAYLVEEQAADLAALVKNAYWELVYARQDIEVKKLSLKLAMNLRDETSRKIESGVLAAVEIYQPDSEIARREELLIGAERDIADAEDNLKLLINSNDWQTSIIPEDSPGIDYRQPDLEAVLNNVLSLRPDIKAAELLVQRAEIMVLKAEDNLKPSLALSGAAGMTGDDDEYGNSLDETISDPNLSWQIGLTFEVPLGNRRSRGVLVRNKAELNNARHNMDLLRQEATRSAREAVRNVKLAFKTIEATRKTSLASRKRLEAEQAKFDVGLSTANDVLEFQDSYAQALISEKRALIDLARAKAELDRVQGIVRLSNKGKEQTEISSFNMVDKNENKSGS